MNKTGRKSNDLLIAVSRTMKGDYVDFYSTEDHNSYVKEYLREKRFRFREVNVERDPEGARELQRRNIMGVPVLLINNRPIVGFDKAQIDKLLGIR